MKILSWDVGIVNLAYCLMEKKGDDDFIILDWGVINLVSDRLLCDFALKTKRTCGKIGKFTANDCEDVSHVLCKTHKDKYLPEITESDTLKCEKCDTQSKYIISEKKVGWCEKHYKTLSKKCLAQFKPKKLVGQSCNQQSLQGLGEKMFTEFDKHTDFLTVDTIYIENQPSFLNPTMKTMAAFLYSYFVMRGIVDKDKTKSKITSVNFASPTNKLKIDKKNTKDKLDVAKNKGQEYKITKGLGKTYCKCIVTPEDYKIIEEHKKKDDMADAFLQGFHFMFDVVPEKYVKKLEEIRDLIPEPKPKKVTKKANEVLPEPKKVVKKVTKKVNSEIKTLTINVDTETKKATVKKVKK